MRKIITIKDYVGVLEHRRNEFEIFRDHYQNHPSKGVWTSLVINLNVVINELNKLNDGGFTYD